MEKRLKSRLWILCAAGLAALGLALAPRPARPAIPARPVQQLSGPLTGRIILVDAGHGGTDGGARARDSGVWEKELNLKVALLLRDQLKASGAEVIMTRETDTQFSQNKRQDLTARLSLAQEGHADILVCVHMNEYRSRRQAGPQVFYRAGQDKSRLLAGCLQEALIRELRPAKKRSALAGDYFMLSLDLPSVLVECGFLSNPEEEKLLLTPAYQQRVAKAIHDGITAYFSLPAQEKAE